MFRRHEIYGLILADPEEARRRIKQVYIDARCSRRRAASIIGCTRDTLAIWCETLGLKPWLKEAAAIAKAEGWHHGMKGATGPKLGPRGPRKKASSPG